MAHQLAECCGILLLLVASCAVTSDACSCVSPVPSRDDTIRRAFQYSKNIYAATVVEVACKCFLKAGDVESGVLSCVRYSHTPQGAVQPSVDLEYTCRGTSTEMWSFGLTNQCSSFSDRIAS